MKASELRRFFKSSGPVVLPVIHVLDTKQTARNVAVCLSQGAPGVFLINHDFAYPEMLPILTEIRSEFPNLWLGVNFLGVTGAEAFPVLAQMSSEGVTVDAYWADDARIDERQGCAAQTDAQAIADSRSNSGWNGLYFGGTAFKKQRPVPASEYTRAAALATGFMDVVTTSGVATGQAADVQKVREFRIGCGEHALGIASGVTPDNVERYASLVDVILVSTGINETGNFYYTDPRKLARLMQRTRGTGLSLLPSEDAQPWYLSLMAPNEKGGKFAWLDPSTMYINARSFHALLDVLVDSFTADELDVVAGFDAMGFVLGAAIADRLGKGFVTIRKAGKLPVTTDSVDFVNYSGRRQQLEMRRPAFAPGTRVLLVDQWVETGGTMGGGIALVERQGGVIAGIATICIEERDSTKRLREQYKCATVVKPGSDFQSQCNRQVLERKGAFDPRGYFPDVTS